MRYPYRKPEDDERPRNFTMVWAPVVRAMVQSGATGREWAVLVALMRFQDKDRLGLLHMGARQISDLTGLSEDSVRQALMSLTRRRYLLRDGHEMPILRIVERAARGRPSTYDLGVAREESIDSLKELSRFFSVTIDELICPEEILSAAEEERQTFADKTVSFLCNAMDLLTATLLFLPVFGNGADSPAAVSLFALTGIHAWVRLVFAILIGLTALNGLCGLTLIRLDRPVWNRHRLVTGVALSVLDVAVMIAARQPYAGLLCFALLAVKTFGMMKLR